MEIKEGVIRLGRRPRRITPSEIATILHMIRKPNSMIALLFIQNSSSDVALRVIFLLFLLCFYPLFRPVPAVVLTLETSEVSAILVFTTKTTQSRPQVFSVNGALTCRRLHFWRHFRSFSKSLIITAVKEIGRSWVQLVSGDSFGRDLMSAIIQEDGTLCCRVSC